MPVQTPAGRDGQCLCCGRYIVTQDAGKWFCFYCDPTNTGAWRCPKNHPSNLTNNLSDKHSQNENNPLARHTKANDTTQKRAVEHKEPNPATATARASLSTTTTPPAPVAHLSMRERPRPILFLDVDGVLHPVTHRHIHTYTHTHTTKQPNKRIHKPTNPHKPTQTNKQTNKQTNTYTHSYGCSSGGASSTRPTVLCPGACSCCRGLWRPLVAKLFCRLYVKRSE